MRREQTISVAMCTYNGEKYLQKQLLSIAEQSRLPYELVINDDRSTDATVEIIRSFSAIAPFAVRLEINSDNLGKSTKGITKNFERAVARCSGNLVALCDQDDIWLPNKLAHLSQLIESNTRLGAVFSDAELIDAEDKRTGVMLSQTTGLSAVEQHRLDTGDALSVLMSMTKVYGCTLLVDATLLKTILPVPAHWWFDAWVPCMAAIYSEIAFAPERLFLYRIHPAQFGGASLPTFSERIRRWRSTAKEYWEMSEPMLTDLQSRLIFDDTPKARKSLKYVQGRMRLLRFRAELPSNPITRTPRILAQANNYKYYFNGLKSMLKDLTTW